MDHDHENAQQFVTHEICPVLQALIRDLIRPLYVHLFYRCVEQAGICVVAPTLRTSRSIRRHK